MRIKYNLSWRQDKKVIQTTPKVGTAEGSLPENSVVHSSRSENETQNNTINDETDYKPKRLLCNILKIPFPKNPMLNQKL